MIFKYELGFVAFTWPNLGLLDLSLLFIVLVGRNFVFGICKLKRKNLFFLFKTQFWTQRRTGCGEECSSEARCD